MKNKKQMLSMLMATLTEINAKSNIEDDYYELLKELGDKLYTKFKNAVVYAALRERLILLADILEDDDIPEEYWEQLREHGV